MRRKTVKMLGSIAVAVAAVGFVGCEQITSVDSVDESCPEKRVCSRSGYPWERVGNINNARDIAGFRKVYVITSDGKSILEQKDGEFVPVSADASLFQNDPAVTIAAGGGTIIMATPTRGIRGEGVYVTTESKKVYHLISVSGKRDGKWTTTRYWTPANKSSYSVEAVAVTTEESNNVYGFSEGGAEDIVLASTGYNGSFGPFPVKPDNEEDLLAIDAGKKYTFFYPAGHLPVGGEDYGVYGLTKDNRVFSIKNHNKSGGPYFDFKETRDIIPSQDIAASPVEAGGYATFQANTNNVYYFNRAGEKIDIGAARKITITEDNYLWDAYGIGIWRKRIK